MTEPDSIPPTLIVTGGPQDGATVACDGAGETILGSGHSAHPRLSAGNVAASHARLQWTGEHLLLTDDRSSTGTFVNGEKITEPYPLTEGDRVYLGPPGSPDSVSLLVCPPVPSGGEPLVLEPPEPSFGQGEAEPLVLDSPPVAPAFDFLAPTPAAAAPPPPKPEPAAEPAAVPTIPLKPVPGAAPARKPKPEYSSDIPSIGGDRVREPVRLPPAAPARRPVKKAGPPPLALYGGLAVIVLGALAAAYFFFLAKTPPVLSSLGASKVELGSTLVLTGENFGPDAGSNTVRVGDRPAQVVSASPNQISVKVPADAPIGPASVTVETAGGRSSALSCVLYRAPQPAALEPAVAMPGGEVTITGQHLGGESPSVSLAGRDTEILGSDAGTLRFRVPADILMVEGKSVNVTVRVGGETAAKPLSLMLGRLPMVTEMAPKAGAAGTRVTLRGHGFAADPAGNLVRFGNKTAAVVASKPTELVAVAPGSDMPGSQVHVDVHVQTGGSSSTPRQFLLTRSSAGTFTPRFYPEVFAEHPGHDHVLVSTDVGPLLLLSGRGTAGSTTERAAAVADALNALAETAMAGKPAGVELREKPEPCLAVIGAPDCLAAATPDDVAAYDEKWSSDKPARASARGVAAHWTALVEDQLLLFIRRQRPYRVLEISPRGKVLLEIYGEATRKVGPGNGVPTGVVSPLPTRWATVLREMALVLPAEGPAKGAAAIEGVWTGKVNDGQSPRDVRVTFRLVDGKPTGSLTTRRGALAMDVPLTDVSYDRGAVRFVAAWAGKPTSFEGTLQQGQITGSLLVGSSKQPGGTFTLSFVE